MSDVVLLRSTFLHLAHNMRSGVPYNGKPGTSPHVSMCQLLYKLIASLNPCWFVCTLGDVTAPIQHQQRGIKLIYI